MPKDTDGIPDGPVIDKPRIPDPIMYTVEWACGIAQNAFFGAGHPWTRGMQNSTVMKIDRGRVRLVLGAHCSRNPALISSTRVPLAPISLGGELGEIPWYQYAFSIFPSELLSNATAAFTGSWTGGSITIRRFDCCKRAASIHVHGFNVTGTASLTHGPPSNGSYAETSGLPNDVMGSNGPMHSCRQTYDWDEEISF